MREEEEYDLRQTRGGEYSGSALRGHWNNTRTAYKNDECNETNHTYYRGNGDYNSKGKYACANIDNYYDDSCGYTGQYGGYDDNYGGNYCNSEYGKDYNGNVGVETDAYETNSPPQRKN